MRSLQHAKTPKEVIRRKIDKTKRARKPSSAWHFRNDIGMENLKIINEALRVNKARSKSNWKLVPKDSCEVYKERRRRQKTKQSQHQGRVNVVAESNGDAKCKEPKTVWRSNSNTIKKRRKHRKGGKHRKRWSHSDSSVPSYSTYSETESSVTNSTSRSTSEMDYE